MVLTKMNIAYKKKMLHIAEYDSSLLLELFKRTFRKSEKYCKQNEFFGSTNSNILHFTNCASAKRVQITNKKYFNRTALLDGCKLCENCLKKSTPQKIHFSNPIVETKTEFLTDEYIERTCNYFKVKYHIGIGVVFINTNFTKWKIYFNNEKITNVFHQNTRPNKNYKNKKAGLNAGYHLQNIKNRTFFDVVRYIKKHDTYKYLYCFNTKDA